MSFSQRRRSISTPQLEECAVSPPSTPSVRSIVPKRKRFSFRSLFNKHGRHTHSNHRSHEVVEENSAKDEADAKQRQLELDLIYKLMQSPDEMVVPDCRPDTVKTVCYPAHCSQAALRFDKKLYQVDVCNVRINTLDHLAITALLASDVKALTFLTAKLDPMESKRTSLWADIDKVLSAFIQCPDELTAKPRTSTVSTPAAEEVNFFIATGNSDDDEDEESHELHWKDCTQDLSADSSSESGTDGPTPEEVKSLARQIRKAEVTRFKHHKVAGRHKSDTASPPHQPPPPNPLGHSNRAMLRSNVSIPAGLCLQSSQQGSSALLSPQSDHTQSSASLTKRQSHQNLAATGAHHARGGQSPALPFNLLSLTAQLTWLISEYLEHGSPTYDWALQLVGDISKMSVTKSTWLNLHQQVRATTELLYNHGNKSPGRHVVDAVGVSAKAEVAWQKIVTAFTNMLDPDSVTTITAVQARCLLTKREATAVAATTPTLIRLSDLLEKKFHLAYVCDVVLWRQYRHLTVHQAHHPSAVREHQLLDFRIRSLQLRLDKWNFQNWTQSFIDFLLCWLADFPKYDSSSGPTDIDRFCIQQFVKLGHLVNHLGRLVHDICHSDFMDDNYWTLLEGQTEDRLPISPISPTDPSATGHKGSYSGPIGHRSSQDSLKHLHIMPHTAQTGCLLDLRPMEADLCSLTYSEVVRQMRHHAVSRRPLSYFAKRTLYDIAIELDCQVDWRQRLASLMSNLETCYAEWDRLLRQQISAQF